MFPRQSQRYMLKDDDALLQAFFANDYVKKSIEEGVVFHTENMSASYTQALLVKIKTEEFVSYANMGMSVADLVTYNLSGLADIANLLNQPAYQGLRAGVALKLIPLYLIHDNKRNPSELRIIQEIVKAVMGSQVLSEAVKNKKISIVQIQELGIPKAKELALALRDFSIIEYGITSEQIFCVARDFDIEKVKFSLETLKRPELAFLIERGFLTLSLLCRFPIEFADERLALMNAHPHLRQAIEENKINSIHFSIYEKAHIIEAASRLYDDRFSRYFNEGLIPFRLAFQPDRLAVIVSELENNPFFQECLADGRISPELLEAPFLQNGLIDAKDRLRYLAKMTTPFVAPRELLRQVMSDEKYRNLPRQTQELINDEGGLHHTIAGAAERTVKLMREFGLTYFQLEAMDERRLDSLLRNADILEGFLAQSRYASFSAFRQSLNDRDVLFEMNSYRATVYLARLGFRDGESVYHDIHEQISRAPRLLEAFMEFSDPKELEDYIRSEQFQTHFVPLISLYDDKFYILNDIYTLLDAGVPFQEILAFGKDRLLLFRQYIDTVSRLIREKQIRVTEDLSLATPDSLREMLVLCDKGLHARNVKNPDWHSNYMAQRRFLEPDAAYETPYLIEDPIIHCMNREYLEQAHFCFFQEDPALIDTQKAYELFEKVTESSAEEYGEAQFCMALLISYYSELTPESFLLETALQKHTRLMQTVSFLERAALCGHKIAQTHLEVMNEELAELARANPRFFNTGAASSSPSLSARHCVIL